jgi:hypothetical protein
MRSLIIFIAIAFLLVFSAAFSWAAIDTATATVSAILTAVADVNLDRDTNSVTRGSASQVVFDKTDDKDMTGGDAGYMYAPYRSETGKNWHVAKITANGSNMVLSASVSGTLGSKSLSDILKVWCGGFFTPGATTPITGTASTEWEYLNGWQRSLNKPFTGSVSFNYQLNISEVGAGTYSGNITFTLTTT